MKKPSKQWREFCQLIDIVDIRIGKQQRKLVKVRDQHQALLLSIEEKWSQIKDEQSRLKSLKPMQEKNALSRLFMRRECIKSAIESLFFDVSVVKQKAEDLEVEIANVEAEKRRLEKRKDALNEIQEQLR